MICDLHDFMILGTYTTTTMLKENLCGIYTKSFIINFMRLFRTKLSMVIYLPTSEVIKYELYFQCNDRKDLKDE